MGMEGRDEEEARVDERVARRGKVGSGRLGTALTARFSPLLQRLHHVI